MGPKKGRRVRKIEVPTDSVLNLSWGRQRQIYSSGGRIGRQEKGRRHRNRGRMSPRGEEEARVEETHSQEEGVAEKRARTEKSDTETEAGGEVGTSKSRYKKGYMTNIYLTELDEEVIVDFVKDKLSFKVFKACFESQRTHYSKLTQPKSGEASKEMMECQNWIHYKFGFLRSHIRCKRQIIRLQANASAASAHNISRDSTDADSMEITMRNM